MTSLAARERRIFRVPPVADTGIDLRSSSPGGCKGYHWKPYIPPRPKIEMKIPYPDGLCKRCCPEPLFFARHEGLKVADILRAACWFYQVRLLELVSNRRHAGIIRPRHVAMWFCRNYTPLSLPQIARSFGGRDHTTILAAVRKIDRERSSDPVLRDAMETISASLKVDLV